LLLGGRLFSTKASGEETEVVHGDLTLGIVIKNLKLDRQPHELRQVY